MSKQIFDAIRFIEQKIGVHYNAKPKVAIVIGSGLGTLVDQLIDPLSINYSDIPHFIPQNSQPNEGRLVFGYLNKTLVVLLHGRIPYFEGHTMDEVVFPTRVVCLLGVDTLILTNSAGGVNPAYREADLMLINDHINLIGDNPLRGANARELGPRFPDLTETYNRECSDIMRKAAEKNDIALKEGVYVALSGPTFETPAEVRMIRVLGGDAVGMSTIPEAITANHLGVRVVGLSCITNLAAGITTKKVSHGEIIQNAGNTADKVAKILFDAVPSLAQTTIS